MKIAIDLNGVVRDIFTKTEQVYTKFYLDEFEETQSAEFDKETKEWVEEDTKDDFKYELNLPVTSMNLIDHFKFKEQDELYNFFYVDFPMQIFGHSPSVSANTFNVLNDLYVDLRDENELTIISDEIGKSKPATLFFLSKYGCLIENIKFYSKITIEDVYDTFDVIITSNPDLLSIDSDNKTIIKVKTSYNSEFKSNYEINSLSDLREVLNKNNLL
jgi:hypothetical protein